MGMYFVPVDVPRIKVIARAGGGIGSTKVIVQLSELTANSVLTLHGQLAAEALGFSPKCNFSQVVK